ncbi:hypothetical protein [Lysobacter antibioticus]|uniref:Uncharacterized protein n=1 Tax=Lysobacter antibioticus TaxID=84531 RepID=A0A0S2F9H7_LYSAN|nr:hypothetical protein [Lysobacter antibioticus]ALN80176.1 hypothetical protein LA76x_2033 [Lysobacter antibioticus]
MARAKPDPNVDRYGSVRACAAVPAAQAALQGLDESISAAFSRGNPTPAQAAARLTVVAASDNLLPGDAVSASAIRLL